MSCLCEGEKGGCAARAARWRLRQKGGAPEHAPGIRRAGAALVCGIGRFGSPTGQCAAEPKDSARREHAPPPPTSKQHARARGVCVCARGHQAHLMPDLKRCSDASLNGWHSEFHSSLEQR